MRGRGGASSSGTANRSAATSTGSRRRTRGRSSGISQGNAGRDVNRDALLQALFPNGVPAREEVIRRANAWLDEAEQLAKSK
jgi:hypothetical protein